MGAVTRNRFLHLLSILASGCTASIPDSVPLELPGTWGKDLSLPNEMAAASAKGELNYLPGLDEFEIPVRIFRAEGTLPPVLIIHGLQSHSGWFVQSAAMLADLGHPVYSFDRSGSGLSQAPRGDIKDFMAWAREIDAVAEEAMKRHGTGQVYLFGHCFGAITATVYACEHPDRIRALMLSSPGIYTHATLARRQILKILLGRAGSMNFAVRNPLNTELFSELDEYKRFIAADPLALLYATGDFYWQTLKARRYLKANAEKLTMPVFVGLAGTDPVSDAEKNSAWFASLSSPRKALIRYEGARHILEFSPERDRFFTDLGLWLASVEKP